MDTLIRTGGNKGELLLKELFIEDRLYCYCDEPSELSHVTNTAEDLKMTVARNSYLKPLEGLKGRVGVQKIVLTREHEMWI